MNNNSMKRTPLNQVHIDAGARMVDFGGWHMPVQYSGLSQEHNAVRTRAGLFDVSHMGEVTVEGEGAELFLNQLVTNNVSRLKEGQAQYTVMCYENGGVVDDLLVYKRGTGKYLLCINAGNIEKDWEWIESRAKGAVGVKLHHASDEFCQIAIQGPLAEKILQPLVKVDLAPVKYYHFVETELLGKSAIVSRTGYTGEDGFEIYAPAGQAVKIWQALMVAGAPLGLIPCGLGARDTLRTEMKFPLYGHEITAETNPLEAGLGWVTKLDKPMDFAGKTVLQKIKAEGPKQALVGLKVLERGIPRQGYEIFDETGKEKIGVVTSGTLSPSLGTPIAIAYVKIGHEKIGSKLMVQIRDRRFPAEVIPTPFYKRPGTA
jgi:aminomethyltransferase